MSVQLIETEVSLSPQLVPFCNSGTDGHGQVFLPINCCQLWLHRYKVFPLLHRTGLLDTGLWWFNDAHPLQRTEKANMNNTLGTGCLRSSLQLHFNNVMSPSPLWPGALSFPLLVSLFYHIESDKAKALLYGICIYAVECDAELVERRKWCQ